MMICLGIYIYGASAVAGAMKGVVTPAKKQSL
jgi:hypothetical protein